MPNKDSFTFSDKLRKSKSVPLSKRLPSIVGGQNKQKRTLVQRAQRDLPFILVAACALLLLPFLSRNGNDDITGPGNFDWNREGLEEPFIEGGGGTLEPAGGMQDPLDLILTPRSAVDEGTVTPGKPDRDVYGTRDRERTDYSTRRGYDDDYRNKTTTPPATSKFGKTARPAVRKSVERTPTKTRELRVSQVPTGRGATSTSHALPIGQAPKSEPSGSTINPGVRPVALQPMGAHGNVGRSMTGENLYAEAARSIGAMNAGGSAKANLLASQMKDQDGMMSALGPAGAFGGAGSPRPGGAGGGPNNNNGYNIGKPWWWDMMQARSQKWWELFEYKWREMMWTNIYDIIFNGGKQIANCLIFGNKEIDVSNMFGKKAGADDYICKKKDIPSLQDYMEFGQHSTTTKEGGKETGYSYSPKEWFELCGEGNYVIDPAKRKGALQVRLECLGFGTKWLKRWKASKTYSGDCSKVNNDPMEYSYSVKKGDKEKERLENKTVIVLLAKVKNNQKAYYKGTGKGITVNQNGTNTSYEGQVTDEIAIYATRSNSLKMTDEQLKKLSGEYCELTRLVAFVSKNSKGETDRRINDYDTKEAVNPYSRSSHDVKDSKTEYTGRDGKKLKGKRKYYKGRVGDIKEVDTGTYRMSDVEIGQINAAQNICNDGISKVKPFTLDDLLDRAELGNVKGKGEGEQAASFQQCKIIRDTVKFNNDAGDTQMKIANQECSLKQTARVAINGEASIQATIEGVGSYNVFAVLLETIDNQTDPRVMSIHSFNTDAEKKARKNNKENPNLFSFTQLVATKGLNPNSTKEVVTQSNSGTSNQMTNEQFKTAMEATNKIDNTQTKDSTVTSLISSYASSGSSSSGTPTARGQGRVIWIVTDAKELNKNNGYVFTGKDISEIEGSDFVETNNTIIYDVCAYRWCNEEGSCVPAQTERYKNNRNNTFCKIEEKCYIAEQVTVESKLYLVAIRPSRNNSDCNEETTCEPFYWTAGNTTEDFNVFHPNSRPTVRIAEDPKGATVNDPDPVFKDLHAMALESDPTMFKLFPQYITKEDEEKAQEYVDLNCVNIPVIWTHDPTYVSPNAETASNIDDAVAQILECQKYIKQLDKEQEYQTLYFIGSASKDENSRGSDPNKTGCSKTNPHQTYAQCNQALSQDRALYAMDIIAQKMEEEASKRETSLPPVKVEIANSDIQSYHGFNNTHLDTSIASVGNLNSNKRYESVYTQTPEAELTFKLVALGASDETRAVTISFVEQLNK
ncbi:MAG: hypothetical protein K6E94_03245 [Elusimicrobiaceae bacterium]|nr:hypothetical protein [Elusimicrobiaceae bacterium]